MNNSKQIIELTQLTIDIKKLDNKIMVIRADITKLDTMGIIYNSLNSDLLLGSFYEDMISTVHHQQAQLLHNVHMLERDLEELRKQKYEKETSIK